MESDESIYNLIPKQLQQDKKKSRFKSRLRDTVPPSGSTFGLLNTTKMTTNEGGYEAPGFEAAAKGAGNHTIKNGGSTFGREVAGTVDPANFMRKGEKSMKQHPPPATSNLSRTAPRKPPVVARTEKPVMGLTTEKNFVRGNALEAMQAVPKKKPKPPQSAVDSNTFGTVPKYLTRIKRDVETERQYLTELHTEKNPTRNQLNRLSEDERLELIQGLKKKWEEVHKQYQALTFNIDTVTKVHRKEGLEVEMEQIEKAIQKLSKRDIFVYDDVGYGYY